MNLSEIKAISIPEGEVVRIEDKGVVIWEQVEEATYKNWVHFSINADGTIYNNGLGYKDGYRIRSGGAEGANTNGTCTGFIPFKKGDVLRIYPQFRGLNTVNALNYANASFQNIGQSTGTGGYGICGGDNSLFHPTTDENGISVLHLTTDLSNEVAYIRVTNQIGFSDPYQPLITTGADMIITVNEEIAD